MISCDKGNCKIVGNLVEIQADISTIIHAIDITFSKKFGEKKSEMYISEAIEVAFKYRGENAEDKMAEGNNVTELLSSLLKIIKGIKDGN